jgi:hypothetical protein
MGIKMDNEQATKLPFEPSVLIEHGDVGALTKSNFGNGGPGDGNGGGAGYS